jgi:hypothetical protein
MNSLEKDLKWVSFPIYNGDRVLMVLVVDCATSLAWWFCSSAECAAARSGRNVVRRTDGLTLISQLAVGWEGFC